MKKVEKHTVPKLPGPKRLSDYVPGIFESIVSKKGMKKAIEKGLVKVNGQVGFTSTYVSGGEVIDLYKKSPKEGGPTVEMDLTVLYEDGHLAIIDKPAGVIVSGNKKQTLENALPSSLSMSEEVDALERPLPAHRLDFATSGALLIGKTSKVLTALNRLFADRSVHKIYHAITTGTMKETEGKIESVIKGKKAITEYKVLNTVPSPKWASINLVELSPISGRRHQLRIHMSELGHPILGDKNYGEEGKILRGKGLFLHALSIKFAHPITEEEISVTSPIPQKFDRILNNKIKEETPKA